MPKGLEHAVLKDGPRVSRLICGLWQVADLEKHGATIDPDRGADVLEAYVADGFDTFDMADHYGSAELIAGRLLARDRPGARPLALTKWCPQPGPMTADVVRAGVQERLDRLAVGNLDLIQLHWWTFQHPAWLDALHEMNRLRAEGLIGAIGVTNFDAAHLGLALADGVPVASNQVSFSLIDRRAAGPLSALCARSGVRLLAYGTLCGGFLSESWLGRPEPTGGMPDWSRSKYKRFIDTAGGWEPFQRILAAAAEIAAKHGVSVSNVATRWVLEHPAVAAAIVGARITESEHRADNARVFAFALDEEDRERLEAAFAEAAPIPGDCGDEYRRPPFLTASGDLSHHLEALPSVYRAERVPGRPERLRVRSGSVWEEIAGYSRAVRIGDRIWVSGTTATHGADRCIAPGDAGAQTTYILDKIAAAIAALDGSLEDVVRTRIYLADASAWEAVAQAHGRSLGDILPANTLVEVSNLIGEYEVEIEAEAVVTTGRRGHPSS